MNLHRITLVNQENLTVVVEVGDCMIEYTILKRLVRENVDIFDS